VLLRFCKVAYLLMGINTAVNAANSTPVCPPLTPASTTSPTGHFAYWTVRLLFGHFAYWTLRLLVISPTRHFAHWTVCLLDSSPTRHFAYCLDSSPTYITHLILFYSGSFVGKIKSNL